MNPVYEISWYGAWWLAFIAIALVGSRYFGCRGAVIGAIGLTILIYILDSVWISSAIKNHPEHGRDTDFVFMLGVLLRAVLFNIVLTPVTIFAFWLRKRSRSAQDAANV